MKKQLIALATSLAVLALNLPALALTFSDMNDNTPYADSIYWMADNGVINGNPDGTFAPDRCVNRAEMLKLTFEVLDLDLRDFNDVPLFNDMDGSEWYAPYVRAARDRGTIQGYEDGEFKGSRCVTRAEALKIVDLEFALGEYKSETGFPIDVARELSNSEPWWGSYFYNMISRNAIGTSHVTFYNADWTGMGVDSDFANPTFDYNINESMSRKEVADLLFRLRTIKDKGINFYGERGEFFPKDLVSKFDSCGTYNDYSGQDWFPAFAAEMSATAMERFEIPDESKDLASAFTEGCLSLDGTQFISIVDYQYGLGFCGELYSYNFQTGDIVWPQQQGEDFYCATEFGKRVGNYVTFTGDRTYSQMDNSESCTQNFNGKFYFEDNEFSVDMTEVCE